MNTSNHEIQHAARCERKSDSVSRSLSGACEKGGKTKATVDIINAQENIAQEKATKRI